MPKALVFMAIAAPHRRARASKYSKYSTQVWTIQRGVQMSEPERDTEPDQVESTVTDISSHGMRLQLDEITTKGGNAAEQQRLRRRLRPETDTAYGDRAGQWKDSSPGRRLRASLASENPFLAYDAQLVRDALGLDGKHPGDMLEFKLWLEWNRNQQVVHVSGDEQQMEWMDLGPVTDEERRAHALQFWLLVHDYSRSESVDDFASLPDPLLENAKTVASLKLTGIDGPDWLKCPNESENISALDAASRVLVTRYRLPGDFRKMVKLFLITGDSGYLRYDLHPDVDVIQIGLSHPTARTFEVRISGMDGFWRREDWDRVWETKVRPIVEEIKKSRALFGFDAEAPDEQRLRRCIPVLKRTIESGTEPELLSMARSMQKDTGKSEKTLQRDLKDLIELLEPTNEG